MPSYEAAIIFKALQRPELSAAVKRAASVILNNGGILRSFEYLGHQVLPYRIFAHGTRHKEGTFLVINFDSPSEFLPMWRDHCVRDSDVIRPRVLRKEVEVGRPCDHNQCEFGELTEDLRKELLRNRKKFIEKL